jgi:serine/threonine protein kinase
LGTSIYKAPEVFFDYEGASQAPTYRGEPADVFSLGILLFVMFFCTYPFKTNNMKEMTKED